MSSIYYVFIYITYNRINMDMSSIYYVFIYITHNGNQCYITITHTPPDDVRELAGRITCKHDAWALL